MSSQGSNDLITVASQQNPDDGASNISDVSVEYLPILPVQK